MKRILILILLVLILEVLGGLGALATRQSVPGWYAELEKPPGTPPNWLFGPVWTLLYAMMGISVGLFWFASEGPARRTGLIWFGVQLALNLSWTPLFFGWHQMGAALVVIGALIIAIGGTILRFRQAGPLPALLLLPYLAWVSYATYLNAGYWLLNR